MLYLTLASGWAAYYAYPATSGQYLALSDLRLDGLAVYLFVSLFCPVDFSESFECILMGFFGAVVHDQRNKISFRVQ